LDALCLSPIVANIQNLHSTLVVESAPFLINTLTLNGGLSAGMQVIEVNNGRMRFWLLPERGMGIWKIWLDELEIGWQSPVRGPVHPNHVRLTEASGLGWLDGFDELLCRCGLESNGAPEFDKLGRLKYPLHGKIANRPAAQIQAGYDSKTGQIAVSGDVTESRFHHHNLKLSSRVATQIGSQMLAIHDSVTNQSAKIGQFQLLYHINFGAPLLEEGATIHAAVKTLVPRTVEAAAAIDEWSVMRAPEAGFNEQVYFLELLGDQNGQAQILLCNASSNLGVSVHFNLAQLPYFTLWKNTAALADGYVVGLEPGTNFPNPHSFELNQNRIEALSAGQTKLFDLRLEFHLDANQVARARQEITRCQMAMPAKIHRTMQPGWSIEAEHN